MPVPHIVKPDLRTRAMWGRLSSFRWIGGVTLRWDPSTCRVSSLQPWWGLQGPLNFHKWPPCPLGHSLACVSTNLQMVLGWRRGVCSKGCLAHFIPLVGAQSNPRDWLFIYLCIYLLHSTDVGRWVLLESTVLALFSRQTNKLHKTIAGTHY